MKQLLSFTEENYLKSIYSLSDNGSKSVSTNSVAESSGTHPSSVNDMIKRLAQKKLIEYRKYKGVTFLSLGKKTALKIIRKHRLWEVFLVDKLGFKWDEVHEIAEQLEHIQSDKLTKKLDKFLDHPTVDPHGDPIPDERGVIKPVIKIAVSDAPLNTTGIVVTVNSEDALLLRHLNEIGLNIGSKIVVLNRIDFDGSISLQIDKQESQFISKAIAENVMITEIC